MNIKLITEIHNGMKIYLHIVICCPNFAKFNDICMGGEDVAAFKGMGI